jgi:hypothetical protein
MQEVVVVRAVAGPVVLAAQVVVVQVMAQAEQPIQEAAVVVVRLLALGVQAL